MRVKDLLAQLADHDTLTITETVEIMDLDFLNVHGKTVSSYADPMFVISGRHWSIDGGKLVALSGVMFECLSSQSGRITNTFCAGASKSKELFRCIGNAACYDTHIVGGEWAKPQGMTVPHVLVDVNGPYFNANSFSRLRFQTNGKPVAPVLSLTCRHQSNWLYGNTLSNINFEIPNAGAIHLQSCNGTSLRDIQIFDADLFGPITDHMIKISRTQGALKSSQTIVDGYFRLSGLAEEGIMDIQASSNDHYADTLGLHMVGGIEGARVRIAVPAQSLTLSRFIKAQTFPS